MPARATGPLIEDHQLFTLFKPPERRGQRAHVHRLRGHVQQMAEDAPHFRIQHPDQAGAARHFHPGQLFDGQTPGMFLIHRSHVIQPVKIRQVLQIGPAFHQLFGATVQQADMRVAALQDLAVQLQHKTQHTMRGRVLRAEVDVEVADLLLARLGVVESLGAVHHFAPSFFSSPGRMYCAPSQGLMKSNCRYSCTSLTGS